MKKPHCILLFVRFESFRPHGLSMVLMEARQGQFRLVTPTPIGWSSDVRSKSTRLRDNSSAPTSQDQMAALGHE